MNQVDGLLEEAGTRERSPPVWTHLLMRHRIWESNNVGSAIKHWPIALRVQGSHACGRCPHWVRAVLSVL